MQFLAGFGEALARKVELPAEPRGVGERFLQPVFPDTLARLPFRDRFGKRRLQPGGFDALRVPLAFRGRQPLRKRRCAPFRRRQRFPEPHSLGRLRIAFGFGAFEQPGAGGGLRPRFRERLLQRGKLPVRRFLEPGGLRLQPPDFFPPGSLARLGRLQAFRKLNGLRFGPSKRFGQRLDPLLPGKAGDLHIDDPASEGVDLLLRGRQRAFQIGDTGAGGFRLLGRASAAGPRFPVLRRPARLPLRQGARRGPPPLPRPPQATVPAPPPFPTSLQAPA